MSRDIPNEGFGRMGRASDDDARHPNIPGKQRLEDWLDQALADTFPASDPVASPPKGALTGERPRGTG